MDRLHVFMTRNCTGGIRTDRRSATRRTRVLQIRVHRTRPFLQVYRFPPVIGEKGSIEFLVNGTLRMKAAGTRGVHPRPLLSLGSACGKVVGAE